MNKFGARRISQKIIKLIYLFLVKTTAPVFTLDCLQEAPSCPQIIFSYYGSRQGKFSRVVGEGRPSPVPKRRRFFNTHSKIKIKRKVH